MYQNKNGMLLVILYVFIYWKVYNLNAIKPPTHTSGIYNAVNKLIYMYAFLYIYVLGICRVLPEEYVLACK